MKKNLEAINVTLHEGESNSFQQLLMNQDFKLLRGGQPTLMKRHLDAQKLTKNEEILLSFFSYRSRFNEGLVNL